MKKGYEVKKVEKIALDVGKSIGCKIVLKDTWKTRHSGLFTTNPQHEEREEIKLTYSYTSKQENSVYVSIALHEIGHFLDYKVSGRKRFFEKDVKLKEVTAWLNAIDLSKKHQLTLDVEFMIGCLKSYKISQKTIDDVVNYLYS